MNPGIRKRAIRLGALTAMLLPFTSALAQDAGKTTPGTIYGASHSAQSAQPQGGSATAGVFAPVKDSEMRPITAGGFVKEGPVLFKDIAKESGLATWRHTMGTLEKKYILEATGSGVALLDYDNDGWMDIYMVNGSTFDALKGTAESPHEIGRAHV